MAGMVQPQGLFHSTRLEDLLEKTRRSEPAFVQAPMRQGRGTSIAFTNVAWVSRLFVCSTRTSGSAELTTPNDLGTSTEAGLSSIQRDSALLWEGAGLETEQPRRMRVVGRRSGWATWWIEYHIEHSAYGAPNSSR